VGIEPSYVVIDQTLPSNVQILSGGIDNAWGYINKPDGFAGFDFIHVYSLASTNSDALSLVKQASAELRPGGRFELYALDEDATTTDDLSAPREIQLLTNSGTVGAQIPRCDQLLTEAGFVLETRLCWRVDEVQLVNEICAPGFVKELRFAKAKMEELESKATAQKNKSRTRPNTPV
jgi:hypothetical protein